MSDFSAIETFPPDIFSSITENISHIAYRFRSLQINTTGDSGFSNFYWETVENTSAAGPALSNINLIFGNGSNIDRLLDFPTTPYWVVPQNTQQTAGWIFNTPISFTRWGIQAPAANISFSSITHFVLEYSDNTTNGTDGDWFIAAVVDDPSLIDSAIKFYYLQDRPIFLPQGDLLAVEQNTDVYFDGKTFGSVISTEPWSDLFVSDGDAAVDGTFSAFELLRDTFFIPDVRILDVENVVKSKIYFIFSSLNYSDKTIPVEYMTLSYNLKGKSYIQLTIPNGILYSQDIINFSNDGGTLKARYVDQLKNGTENITDSLGYSIDSVVSYRGGRNWSVNISGSSNYIDRSYVQIIELTGVSYIGTNSNGSFTLRANLDSRLIPGDKVIYDSVEYDVDNVKQIARYDRQYMEVSTSGFNVILPFDINRLILSEILTDNYYSNGVVNSGGDGGGEGGDGEGGKTSIIWSR